MTREQKFKELKNIETALLNLKKEVEVDLSSTRIYSSRDNDEQLVKKISTMLYVLEL